MLFFENIRKNKGIHFLNPHAVAICDRPAPPADIGDSIMKMINDGPGNIYLHHTRGRMEAATA